LVGKSTRFKKHPKKMWRWEKYLSLLKFLSLQIVGTFV
jgi:hypothetical protein